jgi:hypothetical protein
MNPTCRLLTTFPIPGTRYAVSLVSTKAGVTNDSRLTLYQR